MCIFVPSVKLHLCRWLSLQIKCGLWKVLKKWLHCLVWTMPWRPRGSQSGGEKRRAEKIQVQAEEPQGTDFHQTISKRSSKCWLLIGQRKCFVLLCQIGTALPEFFSWVRTQQLLSYHFCPVRSPRFCVQGELSFSTFLTRNEGTTDESDKCLRWYQQEHFNLHQENSVSDWSQGMVN